MLYYSTGEESILPDAGLAGAETFEIYITLPSTFRPFSKSIST